MTNPLGDLISRGEGGYNSYNRGTKQGHIVPANQKIDFAKMTLEELQYRQSLPISDPKRVFAVGKYQVIPSTLKKAIADLGLGGTEYFSPELQERIFADSLILGKRPQISGYIKGQPGVSLYSAQKATCQEWASVDDPDTPGKPYKRYEQAGNHATTSAIQVAEALNQMRADYEANIVRGMSAEDAWRSVTGQIAPSIAVRPSRSAYAGTSQSKAPLEPHLEAPTSHIDVLPEGSEGAHVKGIQHALARLGYRDPHGHPLAIDNAFGPNTKHALQSFQRAHHLHVDGIVGKDTRAALQDALHAPLLSEATNPQHHLYAQILHGIHKLPQGTYRDEQERTNAAVALTISAHLQGLNNIDHVVLGTNGTNLFAVRGRMDDPAHRRVHVDHAQAMSQSMDHRTPALQVSQVRPPMHDMQAAMQATQAMHSQIEQHGPTLGISR